MLDSVELLNHLRKSPGAQRGQNNNSEQSQRVGAEERVERAGRSRYGFVSYLCKTVESLHKAAVVNENSRDYRDNADNHDNTLNKVVDSRSHVAARDNVNTREHAHSDDTPNVGNVERHFKQT